jgi:putative tryptophan/tyrosine transport system substrate-binding protein
MPNENPLQQSTPENPGTPSPSEPVIKSTWRNPTAGIIALVVFIALGALLYSFFPSSGPSETTDVGPKKIGIAYFRQGISSMEGLKKKLVELGYTDITYIEKEISIGPNLDKDMETAITKLIQEDNVDLIWEDHEFQARAALAVTKKLNRDVPIVFLSRFHDPISFGLAASFKSSGNNATGIVENLANVADRNLAFLLEINPNIKTIGLFSDGFMVPTLSDEYIVHLRDAISELGLNLIEYTTEAPPPEAESVWHETADAIKSGEIDALMHLPGHFYETQEYAEYDLAKRLGIVHSVPYEDLDGGGHFSYTSNFGASGEQSAVMVDKIFKGTKPADIPIEYGATSRLALNLKRAEETGLKFTDSMLYIADEKREE